MEPVTDFVFFSSKITVDGEYSHGIKRPLLFGRKAMTNLDNILGFPGGSVDKESACNAGDAGSIPGLGKVPWRKARQPIPASCWRIPGTEEPRRLQCVVSQSQT